jgi:hypothetical protein
MSRRALPSGIRRRGPSFTYTWRDHTGRQYSRRAGATLAEAEAFKRKIDDQLALGRFRPGSKLTFAQYAAGWIETAPLKDPTRYRYRSILTNHVLPVFGPVPLSKIHAQHVRSWVASEVAGPRSASSTRQAIAVLRSCLASALLDGHLDTLPMQGVKLPRATRRRPPTSATTEQVATWSRATAPQGRAAGPVAPVHGTRGRGDVPPHRTWTEQLQPTTM